MNDLMIRIDNVYKEYRLGLIGGGTLQGDIQSWWAKVRGKEDPNSIIGSETQRRGEHFLALNGISFEVKKGERVGIIGHNGAGKSTLLKLLSRVTAPTKGEIYLNGRVASMLEVGTGFHPELTGRQNVYMNGAILGMSKEEIDSKMDDIIEFSEVGQFIDTPVKRYSSGMYVKLAFSVAAHLDSEIMIMDEVLAVGDMAFQKKCLTRMREVSEKEGRTVLYVSHNMNTIRQLCDRCVVLEKGKVVLDGETETAIAKYLGSRNSSDSVLNLAGFEREKDFKKCPSKMELLELENKDGIYEMDSVLRGRMTVSTTKDFDSVIFGVYFHSQGVAVTSVKSAPVITLKTGEKTVFDFEVDLSRLAPGEYTTKLVLSQMNEAGQAVYMDALMDSYAFEIVQAPGFMHNQIWKTQYNGFLTGKEIVIK